MAISVLGVERTFEAGESELSLLHDLEEGGPFKLDRLTAAVIGLGDRLDISVPRTPAVRACARLTDPATRAKLIGPCPPESSRAAGVGC